MIARERDLPVGVGVYIDRSPTVHTCSFQHPNPSGPFPLDAFSLLDEWCHDSHINERNEYLGRFQEFAKKHNTRVTFLSGDVSFQGILL